MRILMLAKRLYSGRDVLTSDFGRVFELATNLARIGHDVRVLVLDYYRSPPAGQRGPNPLWRGFAALPGLPRYLYSSLAQARRWRPHWVLATSDVYHVIWGRVLASACGARLWCDLYDHYEAFGASRVPGVRMLYRRAVRGADQVSAVSPELERWVHRVGNPSTMILPNAIPRDFAARIHDSARPDRGWNHRTLGAVGSVSITRDLANLIDVVGSEPELRDWRVVLAGPLDGTLDLGASEQVHYLGDLPYSAVPELLGQLDLLFIGNVRGAFGDHCFPQKLNEALAAGKPLVVARTRGLEAWLPGDLDWTYQPGDRASLREALLAQARAPRLPQLQPIYWDDLAAAVSRLMTADPGVN